MPFSSVFRHRFRAGFRPAYAKWAGGWMIFLTRLQGRAEFQLRVGDYRIIYAFDVSRNELSLVTLGHRREVYRL